MKRVVSGIVVTLLLIGMLTSVVHVQPVKAAPTTITVPDDYLTIVEAVDNANDGDTVFVKSGVYVQPPTPYRDDTDLYINKSIALVGQDEESTIVQANGLTWSAAQAFVLKIYADNVTVKGFTFQNGKCGCMVYGTGCVVSECRFMHNREGVSIMRSGNRVSDCFINDSADCGVVVLATDNNTLASNTIENSHVAGIFVYSGSDNVVFGNEISHNGDCGIVLSDSCFGNLVTDNAICFNGWNSTYHFYDSGITLQNFAESNQIIGNNVSDNKRAVFQSMYSSGNLIYHNSFIDNRVQVAIDTTGSPETWAINQWDNGYPSGGNYWSDYDGPDQYSGPYQNLTGSDSIGDRPASVLDSNNVDHYPLVTPYIPVTGDVNKDGIVDMTDIAIVASAFGSSLGDPRWNPIADVNQDGEIDLMDIALVASLFGNNYP